MLTPRTGETLLSCQAGLESYSVPLASISRLARGELIEPNPEGTSPLGWLVEAGEHIPVWSLAARLGSRFEVNAASGTVLLFADAAGSWGLVVDRVRRGGELGPRTLLPLPAWVAPPAPSPFAGVVLGEDGLELLLEAGQLDPRRQPAIAGGVPDASPILDTAAAEPDPAYAPPLNLASLTGPRRMILFSTSPGGEAPVLFGLSLSQVEEILRPQPLLKVPGTEPSFLGLVAWRNQAVPVLDLSLRMGAGPSFFEGESRFLVARGARRNERLAFAVRPEIQVLDLPVPNRPSQRGRLLDLSLVRGVFELEAGTVFFPDLDRFLAARL